MRIDNIQQNKTFYKAPTFKALDKCAYQTFVSEVERVYGTKDFAKIAKTIYENPNNLIGEGHSKLVYKIEGIRDFVLALIKRDFNPTSVPSFEAAENLLPKYNFGQAIAANNSGLLILGKVNGREHSIHNWHRFGILNEQINHSQAMDFLSKIEEIKTFPLDAFEHFGSEIKYLNENSIRMDSLNPNNILFDRETKTLNFIDVEYKESFNELPRPFNSVTDMIAVLLDSVLHRKYFEMLTNSQKNSLTETSKTLIEKCKSAASNINLGRTPANTRRTLEIASKDVESKTNRNLNHAIDNYDYFVSMYKDII